MNITIITLFPDSVRAYCQESILKRAQEHNLIKIFIVNMRDYATDKHKSVDDRPYGGGAGMVLRPDIIVTAIQDVVRRNRAQKSITLLTSPRGTPFTQDKAQTYTKKEHVVIVAGHYEGCDERIASHIDEEISLGDFVLTGGELCAMAITDAITRLIPGVLKKDDASQTETFMEMPIDDLISIVGSDDILTDAKSQGKQHIRLLEYPHYTRPPIFDNTPVPEILLSGNHEQIYEWRIQQAYQVTKQRRPDLLYNTNV